MEMKDIRVMREMTEMRDRERERVVDDKRHNNVKQGKASNEEVPGGPGVGYEL
jgi:hypothetical protein